MNRNEGKLSFFELQNLVWQLPVIDGPLCAQLWNVLDDKAVLKVLLPATQMQMREGSCGGVIVDESTPQTLLQVLNDSFVVSVVTPTIPWSSAWSDKLLFQEWRYAASLDKLPEFVDLFIGIWSVENHTPQKIWDCFWQNKL